MKTKNKYTAKGQKGFVRRKKSLSQYRVSTYLTEAENSSMQAAMDYYCMDAATFIRMAIDKAVISQKRKAKRAASQQQQSEKKQINNI